MKKVYYVRHGTSMSNLKDITSGAEDDTELADLGREQAKVAGQTLASANIDMIVCSPMKRAVETAKIIAKEVGFDVNKIQTSRFFIERSVGVYSGRPHAEYREAIYSGNLSESVESPEQMVERMRKGLDWVAQLDANNIVIVAHSAMSRTFRVIHDDLHHDEMYKRSTMKNAEIYEFEL